MAEFHKAQFAKVALIAGLVLITPLLSPSMRARFLYLLFNLLIILLGVESGILSAFPNPPDDKKPSVAAAPEAAIDGSGRQPYINGEHSAKVVEKQKNGEKSTAMARALKVKKCPSMPSLFFIGGSGGDVEDKELEEVEEELDVGGVSRQELFAKAESFIGNFYKQLKIQREESWKRLHGLYHKAF